MDLRHSRATLLSLGAVDTTGVPVLNQVARFFDEDTVQGSANFTFSGTILALTGNMTISSFLAIGATPATIGELRLSNTDAITWRNFNNDGDLTVFDFADSDHFQLGQGGGILQYTINVPFVRMILAELNITKTATNCLIVQSSSNPVLQVDTSLLSVRVEDTLIVRGRTDIQGSAATTVQSATVVVATPSGATATAAGIIPAGALVLGVTVRSLNPTGPAGYDVGDGTNTDRWGNSISTVPGTASSSADFVSSAVEIFPVANDVVLTSDGVAFTGGTVRVNVSNISLAGPIS